MSYQENFQDNFQAPEPNFLFFDTSSSCTGYAIASLDFRNKVATIHTLGALWLNDKSNHNQKYHYMQKALEVYFYIVEKVDFLVHEMYSVNPKRMTGVMVVPELIGAIKAGCEEVGIKSDNILPQTWRKHLGIKVVKDSKGKKDYKTPVMEKIRTMVDVPNKMTSNITGNERTTPSDVFDAAGIAYGWLTKLEGADGPYFDKIKFAKDIRINPHLGYDIEGDL